MNITDVRIRKINDEGKMKADVSITFDDEFVVLSVRNVFFVDEKLRNSLQRSSFLQIWGTCMSRSYSDATLVTVDVSLGVQF